EVARGAGPVLFDCAAELDEVPNADGRLDRSEDEEALRSCAVAVGSRVFEVKAVAATCRHYAGQAGNDPAGQRREVSGALNGGDGCRDRRRAEAPAVIGGRRVGSSILITHLALE